MNGRLVKIELFSQLTTNRLKTLYFWDNFLSRTIVSEVIRSRQHHPCVTAPKPVVIEGQLAVGCVFVELKAQPRPKTDSLIEPVANIALRIQASPVTFIAQQNIE